MIRSMREYFELNVENDIGVLDPQRSSKEGMLVFGWFHFPFITRTEADMLQLVKEWGYEDVMKNIWFCHYPIKGKPCGVCHPCAIKMEAKMTFLLPRKAQMRYKLLNIASHIIGKGKARHVGNMLRHF